MSAHVRDRVKQMIDFIGQGKILEAMDEFYAENVAMQENRKEPTVGLAPNIEREKEFLAQVKDFHGFGATAVGIEGGENGTGKALVESWLEFTNHQDQRVKLEQVSVQQWENGNITHERFYYDSAG